MVCGDCVKSNSFQGFHSGQMRVRDPHLDGAPFAVFILLLAAGLRNQVRNGSNEEQIKDVAREYELPVIK